MQFAQILVTDDQALKTRLAIDLILQDPERFVMDGDERRDYERLAVFFGQVATNPTAFPPTGKMAKTVRSIVRRAKGPSQTPTRSKRALKRSQGQQKRDRQERREFVKAYNEAVEAYEKERAEMEQMQAEAMERYSAAPKFNVVNEAGQVVMSGVPAYAIEPLNESEQAVAPAPKIELPATVEKQMEREAQA